MRRGGGGFVPDSGATGEAGFTDDFKVGITFPESSAVPTDDTTFALALAQSDTNADLSETVDLGVSGTDLADTSAAPSDSPAMNIEWIANGTFTAFTTGTLTIECWGGGQGGTNGSATAGGNGGRGADYARAAISMTSGDVFTLNVAAAVAAATNGQDTSVVRSASTLCLAKGGNSASANVGDTTFTGGTGASGAAAGASGGGGGGAGDANNGGNAGTAPAAGAAGTAGGGAGGTGVAFVAGTGAGNPGNPGNACGGGGSGGGGSLLGSQGAGGGGARGKIRLSFTA